MIVTLWQGLTPPRNRGRAHLRPTPNLPVGAPGGDRLVEKALRPPVVGLEAAGARLRALQQEAEEVGAGRQHLKTTVEAPLRLPQGARSTPLAAVEHVVEIGDDEEVAVKEYDLRELGQVVYLQHRKPVLSFQARVERVH